MQLYLLTGGGFYFYYCRHQERRCCVVSYMMETFQSLVHCSLSYFLFIATAADDLSSDLRFRGSLQKPQSGSLPVRLPRSICNMREEVIISSKGGYFKVVQ